MADIAALEAAGFQRVYKTFEEWDEAQKALAKSKKYGSSDVQISYLLERDEITIAIEQNTQEQNPFGVPTTVHYPEVAVVEDPRTARRVACDAANTDLILRVVEDLSRKGRP